MFVSLRTLLLLDCIMVSIKWTEEAIAPPPWANPKLNPCAFDSNGWLMLYWPPDGACYKIFQKGHPCQEDMELTPTATGSDAQSLTAECRCPPNTAEYEEDGHCYRIFTDGPCEEGFYFSPVANQEPRKKIGACVQIPECPQNSIFWPADKHCYRKHTRGPCAKGLLLTETNRLASCRCDESEELKTYKHDNGKCYEHFSKGPCEEKGSLFLNNQVCGCHSSLPHFHEESQQCYELETTGPCEKGEVFAVAPNGKAAQCHCKQDYIRYLNNSSCYRPFTRGPCPTNHILVNTTTCLKQPCQRGYLYYSENRSCHRVGTRGPCQEGKIITFDFRTRPSVDGISYNGLCVCEIENCRGNTSDTENCAKGWIRYGEKCYKLYSQGPCPKGSWLVPQRATLGKDAICECVPGYFKRINEKNEIECEAPIMFIAEYLNKSHRSLRKKNFELSE
ncbi:hypothetical protein WA026_020812 [Henosepilachna vigintioctopunctata]|uniref:DUF4789 domain-containing protein n=1 Tax=Henosepilachna vigintioctopunctata TaxID=420089 RepID=A0AAW1TY19_9CUCU